MWTSQYRLNTTKAAYTKSVVNVFPFFTELLTTSGNETQASNFTSALSPVNVD